jgi:hypothetical protein
MPTLFSAEVKESEIEGKGLFTLEDIPKGAIVWAFSSDKLYPIKGYEVSENKVHNREQMENMPE